MDSKLKAMINILLNEDTSIKQTKKIYWIKKKTCNEGFYPNTSSVKAVYCEDEVSSELSLNWRLKWINLTSEYLSYILNFKTLLHTVLLLT